MIGPAAPVLVPRRLRISQADLALVLDSLIRLSLRGPR